MAIVKEWTTEGGSRIKINDACYANKTPEEMQAARDLANRTALRILYACAEREMKKQQESEEV